MKSKKYLLIISLIILVISIFCVAFFLDNKSGNNYQQQSSDIGSGQVINENNQPNATPHTHTYGEWKIVKEATCTTKGRQECYCSCGEKKAQSIRATGHKEVTDRGIAATCTTDGISSGKHCSVCNEILIAQNTIPASHTDGEWVTDIDATCTGEGSMHQVCSVCDATINTEILPMLPHTDSEWIVDEESTCSTEGSRYKKCLVCQLKTTEGAIPCLSHNYGQSILRESCINDNAGILYSCSDCEANYISPFDCISASITRTDFGTERDGLTLDSYLYETYTIVATGGYGSYQYKYELFKDSSISTPVNESDFQSENTYTVSERNGIDFSKAILKITILDEVGQAVIYQIQLDNLKVLSKSVIHLREHSYGDWIIDEDSTCTKLGTRHRVCILCNQETAEEIPVTEHMNGDWVVEKAATCTEMGKRYQICVICQNKTKIEYIKSLGHSYLEQYDSYNNMLIYTCETCNHSYSTNADINLVIKETYTKFDTVGFKIQTQINIQATGGYGTIYYKYEVFYTQSSTTPIEKLTYDFSSDKDWYGLKAADTVNGCVIQVTAKDNYGHIIVNRVLITNEGIEIIN